MLKPRKEVGEHKDLRNLQKQTQKLIAGNCFWDVMVKNRKGSAKNRLRRTRALEKIEK